MDGNNSEKYTKYNTRFDRIEEKIDKLNDAIVSIARAEQRIIAIEDDMKDLSRRLNRYDAELDILNSSTIEAKRVISVMETAHEQDRKVTHNENQKTYDRLQSIEEKLEVMSKIASDSARTVSVINKLFWIVGTSAIAYLGSQFITTV